MNKNEGKWKPPKCVLPQALACFSRRPNNVNLAPGMGPSYHLDHQSASKGCPHAPRILCFGDQLTCTQLRQMLIASSSAPEIDEKVLSQRGSQSRESGHRVEKEARIRQRGCRFVTRIDTVSVLLCIDPDRPCMAPMQDLQPQNYVKML